MKIMIGTPCYDGKLIAQYVDSLLRTIQKLSTEDTTIFPIFLCYDALLQRARNDLFQMAYESSVDYLFFIDADMSWEPEDFIKLINNKEDFIMGIGCKKSDQLQYAVKILPKSNLNDDIIEIAGGGTAFMRLSKNVITKIWEDSLEYSEEHKKCRMIFDIGVIDGELFSEDIMFCNKWRDLGGKIYLDSTINLGHYGNKMYSGDLKQLFKEITKNNLSASKKDKKTNKKSKNRGVL